MKTELVKGFRDYSGKEAEKRKQIKKILEENFEKYGFELAETPIVEYEEFVKGENFQDEAISDIFKLKDKGNRKLALRYEFTFQLKRLMQNKKLPYKRYQIGEVFRDEPVSSNRFRQFTQCDIDIIGSSEKEEAEILAVIKNVFEKVKIPVKIYFNNRNLLDDILNELKIKNKEQTLREIDKLDKLSETEVRKNLKKINAEKVLLILKKPKSYFKKYPAYIEVEKLEKYLSYYGIKPEFLPTLARGLSYYNGSVFEIKSSKMKETLCAGGSYIFNKVQCTGVAFGLERICSLAKTDSKIQKILLISLSKDKEAIALAEKLRKKGEEVSIFYGKPSKALEYANSYEFSKAIFVGEKEIKSKKFKVKDLKTGKETILKI
jgi:histidyl-tRNA synthetase